MRWLLLVALLLTPSLASADTIGLPVPGTITDAFVGLNRTSLTLFPNAVADPYAFSSEWYLVAWAETTNLVGPATLRLQVYLNDVVRRDATFTVNPTGVVLYVVAVSIMDCCLSPTPGTIVTTLAGFAPQSWAFQALRPGSGPPSPPSTSPDDVPFQGGSGSGLTPSSIPEPTSLVLLGSGLLVLVRRLQMV